MPTEGSMDPIILRRTIRQVLTYSKMTDQEHHLKIAGLGVFHINETKLDGELEVDVWLQCKSGKRFWLTFGNLEIAVGELVH